MGANDPVSSYAVDIVFCIDCTGSMEPYIESVKATARDFHQLLEKKMSEKNKGIRQLRVRVVSFRDLGEESADAIQASPFFTLPDDSAAFGNVVGGLTPGGGGDEAESALEALAVAIRSPWERGLDKRRHVVVVCTDAPAHELGKFPYSGEGGQGRPMPGSLAELNTIWGDETDEGEMEYAAKRLIVFAPSAYPWPEMAEKFENFIYIPLPAGHGMQGSDQEIVLEQVAGSV